jgi:phage terminase Nu1 subunit (DNA packaging protein)
MDVDACRVAYLRHLREAAAGRRGSDGTDLAAERARLARAQAEAQEMKNAQARGELICAGEAEATMVGVMSAVRARLLALPTSCAPLVAEIDRPAECEEVLRTHLYDAMHEIADTKIDQKHGRLRTVTGKGGRRIEIIIRHDVEDDA